MTVHLTDVQEQRLQSLAARNAMSADALAQQCVTRFLDDQEDLHAAMQPAWDDVAAGRLIDHDEVMAMMDDIIENG
jgi:predicted transcriptional regulator